MVGYECPRLASPYKDVVDGGIIYLESHFVISCGVGENIFARSLLFEAPLSLLLLFF